jgi:HEPN domain-containing protein
MKKEENKTYRVKRADRDFRTMNHLLEKKDYNWSLFIGHLVIEKLLKACYVKNNDDHPPLSHNLVRLAEKAKLEVDEKQKDTLVTVTTFNIRARYDDYKAEFYKTCTKEFTETWIKKIKGFRKWIKKQHLTA